MIDPSVERCLLMENDIADAAAPRRMTMTRMLQTACRHDFEPQLDILDG
jgi:hypothetical protein